MSPRKYSGQSEKSAASPGHQHQSTPDNAGQTSSNGNTLQNLNQMNQPMQTKQEEEDVKMPGTVSAKIEEVMQPSQQSMLPT